MSSLRRFAIAALLVLATVAAMPMTAAAQWSYSAPITITNSGAALTDHQVAVTLNTQALISAGKMLTSGDDIRFTDATCAEIPYWIESGINTTTTKIWVRVPSIAASGTTTIYVRYGNASATAASSGTATFRFFDDFNGVALDGTKWSVAGSGSETVGSGVINFTAGGDRIIRSSSAFTGPVVTEMNVTAASGNWPSMAQMQSGTNDGHAMGLGGTTMYNGRTLGSCATHAMYLESSAAAGSVTGIWSMAWSATASQSYSWPGGSATASRGQFTLGTVQLAIGMICSGTGSMSVDWARVRGYAASEPTTSVGTETGIATAPVVTQNPTDNAIACSGGSVTFSANATGYAQVQWQSSTDAGATWTSIAGATGTSYTINPTTLAQNGTRYRALFIATGCNATPTTSATLTLQPAPSLAASVRPSSIAYKPGKMRSITASITPSGACGPFTTQLVSITANESILSTDIQFASYGTSPADLMFNVASNRNTGVTPRIYTVTYRVTDASGNSTNQTTTVTVPLVGGMKPVLPEDETDAVAGIALLESSSNVFASETEIRFLVNGGGRVSLAIFDATGREVTRLVDGSRDAGLHFERWNASDANGSPVPAGTYFARLVTPSDARTIMLKVVR